MADRLREEENADRCARERRRRGRPRRRPESDRKKVLQGLRDRSPSIAELKGLPDARCGRYAGVLQKTSGRRWHELATSISFITAKITTYLRPMGSTVPQNLPS